MGSGASSNVNAEGVRRRGKQDHPTQSKRKRFILISTLIVAAILLNFTGILAPDFVAGFDRAEYQLLGGLRLILLAILAVVIYQSWRPEAADMNPIHGALDMLPLSAALWREDGTLEHCNEVMRRQFGLPERRSLTPLQAERLQFCTDEKANARAGSDQFEVEQSDGRWLQVTSLRLTNGRRLCVIKDISEHRLTKKQLAMSLEQNQELTRRFREEALRAEAASRSKSAFLAHLSHDIRTPLNHIIGFAELIRNEAFGNLGNPRYHTYLDDIKGSGERLLDSFAEVLELAELEGGRRELKHDPIEVGDLLNEVQTRFAGAATKAGIEMKFEAAGECWLSGDRAPLSKMVGNLVDNAVRFTPRGGRVSVVCWESEAEIVIEVTDSGIGIAPERIAELSMPFVLGDAAFARNHGGMGLGLAISRTIAELSGGRLAIESTPPLGTTVAIALPHVTVSDVVAA